LSLTYEHPGLSTIRDVVAAQCANEDVHDPRVVDAAVEKRIAELRPLLDENPDLHGALLRDLLTAKATPSPGAALEARNRSALEPVQTPIYGPNLEEAIALADRTNAHLKARHPRFARLLLRGGGSSPAIVPRLLEEQLERECRGGAAETAPRSILGR